LVSSRDLVVALDIPHDFGEACTADFTVQVIGEVLSSFSRNIGTVRQR
jgi:hypothetical protein